MFEAVFHYVFVYGKRYLFYLRRRLPLWCISYTATASTFPARHSSVPNPARAAVCPQPETRDLTLLSRAVHQLVWAAPETMVLVSVTASSGVLCLQPVSADSITLENTRSLPYQCNESALMLTRFMRKYHEILNLCNFWEEISYF